MRVMRTLGRAAWSLAKAAFAVLVAAWSVTIRTLRALSGGSLLALDFVRSRRSLAGGMLRCPRGHEIETEGGVYQCTRCSFTYRGSMLLCCNPECPSPVTAYLDCPDCGLSVRNPYRWGRP